MQVSSDPGRSLKEKLLRENPPEIRQLSEESGTCGLAEYSGDYDRVNQIYHGDNLEVMNYLINVQDMAGEVTLAYIDPPYSADHRFESRGGGRSDPTYRDSFEDAEYVEFLRERLLLIHELLSEDGSIYVHIGEEMMAHVKMLLDEVFGRENYENTISRKKCHSKNSTKKRYGNVQDFILFYAKNSDEKTWKRPTRPPTNAEKERAMKEYRYVEEETGRRYMKVPIHAPGERDGETGEPWRGMEPPEGKHWTYPPEKLEEMAEDGLIVFSDNGNPRKKVYYDQRDGVPVSDIWLDVRDYYNQQQSITGYPTEKNIDLLERIVKASSNEGDLVLDAFMGSGTTLAAADRLNRDWVGIDSGDEAFEVAQERVKETSANSPFETYGVK
jgi:adenine-specific DNA-methyltransferase